MPTAKLPDVAGLLQLHNARGDSAVISLYGAQLLSWQTADGRAHLYCTPEPSLKPGASIRGGVPVCFPQFSGRGALPKHGLVRNLVWQIDGDVLSGAGQDVAYARLSLSDSTPRAHCGRTASPCSCRSSWAPAGSASRST